MAPTKIKVNIQHRFYTEDSSPRSNHVLIFNLRNNNSAKYQHSNILFHDYCVLVTNGLILRSCSSRKVREGMFFFMCINTRDHGGPIWEGQDSSQRAMGTNIISSWHSEIVKRNYYYVTHNVMPRPYTHRVKLVAQRASLTVFASIIIN